MWENGLESRVSDVKLRVLCAILLFITKQYMQSESVDDYKGNLLTYRTHPHFCNSTHCIVWLVQLTKSVERCVKYHGHEAHNATIYFTLLQFVALLDYRK